MYDSMRRAKFYFVFSDSSDLDLSYMNGKIEPNIEQYTVTVEGPMELRKRESEKERYSLKN